MTKITVDFAVGEIEDGCIDDAGTIIRGMSGSLNTESGQEFHAEYPNWFEICGVENV